MFHLRWDDGDDDRLRAADIDDGDDGVARFGEEEEKEEEEEEEEDEKDDRLATGKPPDASQKLRPQDVPASISDITTSRDPLFSQNVRHEA